MLATDVVRQERNGLTPPCGSQREARRARSLLRSAWTSRRPSRDLPARVALSLVRSALAEVPLVLAEKRCEMLLVDKQHVVEHLSSHAADEVLRDRIHVRRSNGR